MIANRITVEAIDWTMKYLIADSADSMFLWLCIKGIIDRRLISSPNHIPSQEYDEIEISVLMIMVDMKSIL